LTEAQVADAIRKSGYPLQVVVAELLRPDFGIEQEWSYVDKDSGQLRSLDIVAERRLFEFDDQTQPRIRPTLDLLIECKQSDLPFVFFLSSDKVVSHQFPAIAGLFKDTINITTDDDPSSWTMSVVDALDLSEDPFIFDDVDYSMS